MRLCACVPTLMHAYVLLQIIDLQQVTVMGLNLDVEQILMTSVV